MGFQASTTNHINVTRLERNALLGRGMDLNSFTWLLVTCVLFQMYTTLTLIQSTCSSSDATTWHPDQVHLPIFNTLHFTLSVGGEEVPCNLTQVVSNTLGGTSAFGKTITTFYESTQLVNGEPIHQVLQTHFLTPFHVFPTTLSLWGTSHQEGKRPSHKLVN
jgi:hypothetical protein